MSAKCSVGLVRHEHAKVLLMESKQLGVLKMGNESLLRELD